MVIPRGAVETLPAELARGHNVVPVSLSGRVLTVPVEDPLDFELLDSLRFRGGMPVSVPCHQFPIALVVFITKNACSRRLPRGVI
jgi:hypothetical protein